MNPHSPQKQIASSQPPRRLDAIQDNSNVDLEFCFIRGNVFTTKVSEYFKYPNHLAIFFRQSEFFSLRQALQPKKRVLCPRCARRKTGSRQDKNRSQGLLI